MSNEETEPRRRGPLPPALFLASLVAQAVLHWALPIASVVPDAWHLLGAVPIVAGIALAAVADGRFKVAQTAVNPFGEPSALVTAGPFRYSRNPMYLGMVLVLVGVAVALGSLSPLLVPPAFARVLATRFIAMEEEKMERIFGTAYAEYREQVRRWL